MIPGFLLDQTAVVSRWTTTDDAKGNPVRSVAWTASYPCRVDFRSSTEDETVGRSQRVDTRMVCFLPPDADVAAEDDITVDGVTWKVEGEPARLRAFGSVHHVEAELRGVDEEGRT